jgi:serine/threonine-protein kinase
VYAVAVNELAFTYDYYDNGSAAGIPALRWDIERTLEFFGRICRAVAALHEMGLTHRSLKPSNVLVDEELRPVLADPGMLGLRDPSLPLSTADAIYRAPEELGGESTQSPTADIYGLGRLLWFLLLGTDPEEPYQAFATLTSLEGAPPGLVRIVRKATAHDPVARYQWVEELVADLARHNEHDRVGIGATGGDHEPPRQMISLLPVPMPMPRPPVEPRFAVAGQRGATGKWRSFERIGGSTGLGIVLVATITVFVAPAPSPEAAELFGIAMTIGLALGTLFLKPYAERPVLFRLTAFGVALALLVPLELESLVILRWRYTLENGNDETRPQVARFLARRGARDLRGARLARSDLRRADLGRVDLRMANLSGAKMVGTNLSEADLRGADISGADLSGANLASSTVADAKGWLETNCSRTTAMPRSFACVDGRPAGTAP